MNEIVNKLLLAGAKILPEMHSKKPGFTYSLVYYLLKGKKGYINFKKQAIQDIFIKLDKAFI